MHKNAANVAAIALVMGRSRSSIVGRFGVSARLTVLPTRRSRLNIFAHA